MALFQYYFPRLKIQMISSQTLKDIRVVKELFLPMQQPLDVVLYIHKKLNLQLPYCLKIKVN